MNPLISIIIPTFNSEATIDSCLQSIKSQQFKDYEILIIDGQSTDATIAKCNNFNGSLKVISEKDDGVYDAMNKGIKIAGGEWLLFLGSDDALFNSSVLDNISKRLLETNAGFIYGDVKIAGSTSWAIDGTIYDGAFSLEKLFERNICHQAIFYKKEVFGKIGIYNIRYSLCADWDFNLRCWANYPSEYVPIIVSVFNAGGQTSIRNYDDFTSKDIAFKIRKYFSLSFFNSAFKRFVYIFDSEYNSSFKRGEYLTAMYFCIVLAFHSTGRLRILKSYLKNLLKATGK